MLSSGPEWTSGAADDSDQRASSAHTWRDEEAPSPQGNHQARYAAKFWKLRTHARAYLQSHTNPKPQRKQ